MKIPSEKETNSEDSISIIHKYVGEIYNNLGRTL
jgi:hypothetical protein